MNSTAMVGRLEETSPKTKAGLVSGLLLITILAPPPHESRSWEIGGNQGQIGDGKSRNRGRIVAHPRSLHKANPAAPSISSHVPDGTFSDICFTRLAWLIMTGHFRETETSRLSPFPCPHLLSPSPDGYEPSPVQRLGGIR